MRRFFLVIALLVASVVFSLSAFAAEPYEVFPDASFQILSVDVQPITPADVSGLKALMLSIVGDYTPIVVEYRIPAADGAYTSLQSAAPDYVWLVSAAVFLAVLWCTFRAGVSILCRL